MVPLAGLGLDNRVTSYSSFNSTNTGIYVLATLYITNGLRESRGYLMGSRIRQRTVYLATAAIVIAMVGGFALASFPTVFTFTGTNQNGGSVTTGNTIYAGDVKVNLTSGRSFACVATTTTAIEGTGTDDVTVAGESTAPCVTGSTVWYENLTFTALAAAITSVCPITGTSFCVDTFVVSSVADALPAFATSFPFYLGGSTHVAAETLTVSVEYGATIPVISTLDVSVSGS
jgi:hypothetical protein